MPALRLDAALIHLNRADAAGNGQFLGPDPYFDDLFCLAARGRFVSCERIVPTAELLDGAAADPAVNRAMVDGVVEAPGGAHFTSCVPDYGRDEAFQARIRGGGRRPGGLAAVPGRVPGRGRGQHTSAAVREPGDAPAEPS